MLVEKLDALSQQLQELRAAVEEIRHDIADDVRRHKAREQARLSALVPGESRVIHEYVAGPECEELPPWRSPKLEGEHK